jgi:hypothetical protein
MQSLKKILRNYQNDPTKYISREFQDYGYRLAVELDDLKHKSLYIKLAKTLPRALLEQARCFVKDANAHSKGRLFMWKIKHLQATPAPRNSRLRH